MTEDKSMVERYMESAGGNWCSVKNTAVGDAVIAQEVYLDDESFEKSYIVVNGVHEKTGEERKVRLGVQNVKRIFETLGSEKGWVGNRLKCIAHQTYPGLGKEGLLWTGEKAYTQQAVA